MPFPVAVVCPYNQSLFSVLTAQLLLKTYFEDGCEATYFGTFGSWQEAAPLEYKPLKINSLFSASGIKTAITQHAQGQTTYGEFLTSIAMQGSSHCVVNMQKRTMAYLGKDEAHCYEEKIPNGSNDG